MPATYDSIATTTLGSAAATIDFNSIPGSYTDLRLILVMTASTSAQNLNIRYNSDSATNYSLTRLSGEGSAASSGRTGNQAQLYGGPAGTYTTTPQFYAFDIFSYAGSTNKTTLWQASEDNNGSGWVDVRVGLWRNTTAINSINLFLSGGNFNAGTTATLYGILRA